MLYHDFEMTFSPQTWHIISTFETKNRGEGYLFLLSGKQKLSSPFPNPFPPHISPFCPELGHMATSSFKGSWESHERDWLRQWLSNIFDCGPQWIIHFIPQPNTCNQNINSANKTFHKIILTFIMCCTLIFSLFLKKILVTSITNLISWPTIGLWVQDEK